MLNKTIDFLVDIGIPVEFRENVNGFFNKILIKNGSLLINKDVLISDLLHEAGHLAILPSQFRHRANGNIDNIINIMANEIDFSEPDSVLVKSFLQCGDLEATAWAWAAGKYLGIPENIIIQDTEYNKEGASVRNMLTVNSYFGINGLCAAGFCTINKRLSEITSLPCYPNLNKWLQS